MSDATVSCRHCGYTATRNYCAECGAPLHATRRAVAAGKVILAPLYEYIEHARAIFFPKALVEEVRAERFGTPEMLGFWLAAAALAALANAVFEQPSFTGVTLPIIDEIADALATIALLILMYSPLHLVFNRGRRGVSYSAFVLVLLAIGALLYPWLMLARGAFAQAGAHDAEQLAPLVGTLFFIRAFADLYARSMWGIGVRMILYFVVASLLLVSLAGVLAHHAAG